MCLLYREILPQLVNTKKLPFPKTCDHYKHIKCALRTAVGTAAALNLVEDYPEFNVETLARLSGVEASLGDFLEVMAEEQFADDKGIRHPMWELQAVLHPGACATWVFLAKPVYL